MVCPWKRKKVKKALSLYLVLTLRYHTQALVPKWYCLLCSFCVAEIQHNGSSLPTTALYTTGRKMPCDEWRPRGKRCMIDSVLKAKFWDLGKSSLRKLTSSANKILCYPQLCLSSGDKHYGLHCITTVQRFKILFLKSGQILHGVTMNWKDLK